MAQALLTVELQQKQKELKIVVFEFEEYVLIGSQTSESYFGGLIDCEQDKVINC